MSDEEAQRDSGSQKSSGEAQTASESQLPDGHGGDGSQRSSEEATSRVLSLGVDSAGGYLVPYQLDKGPKKRRPKK